RKSWATVAGNTHRVSKQAGRPRKPRCGVHAVDVLDFEGLQDYTTILNAMRAHVASEYQKRLINKTAATQTEAQVQTQATTQVQTQEDTQHTAPHQIWLLEHAPVFTQGQAGRTEHILNPGNIPVVPSDRGGQVTYHGPGQLVAYCLFELAPLKLDAHSLVHGLEQASLDYLQGIGIKTMVQDGAPGVYTEEGHKICSVGLRIRQGMSYHGLSVNVAMDLAPFTYIHPCGYPNLKMTEIRNFVPTIQMKETKVALLAQICRQFGLSVNTTKTIRGNHCD
ncbi:MAG: lipoyl(octanoyl) transferase LipB, partial [Pseudomonadota bacterium]